MIKRIAALGSVLLLSALPVWVGALGLGSIDLKSGLNQPLEARIPLSSLQAGDLENLHVGLAAPEHFQRAGIDRPFFLAKLKFRPQTAADGTSYVRVFSRQRVSEPFLNFLIEVSWPRGRVIREYTLLLDPPVYGAAISRAVKTTVPVATRAPAAASKAKRRTAAAPAVAAASGGSAPAAVPVATGGSYGPTTRSDTLWSLARRFRGDPTVSIQQMMLAILRANPEAFSKGNINTLRAGVVLQIPGNQDIESLSKREALAEVKRQQVEWQEMRRGKTAQVARTPAGKPAAGSREEPAKAVEDKAAEARLKLVSAGQGAGAGSMAKPEVNVAGLRDELNVALEDADTKRVENENLSARLAEADALIADLKRLVELKDDNIAALQSKIGAPDTAAPVTETMPSPTMAAPEAAPTPVAPTPPPPTLLETLRDILPVDPVLLGGGIGLLLLLFGASSWLRRRRAAADDVAETAPVASRADVTEEVVGVEEEEAAETADEEAVDDTVPASDEPAVAVEVDEEEPAPAAEAVEEEDPLAEVNVYLAYERFDQAEELVRGAVEKYPDRYEYRLKLLEIFCAARNVEAFETAAMDLQETVGADHALMEKAHSWWAELSPSRALFAPLDEEPPAEFSDTHVGMGGDDAVFDVTEGDEADEVQATGDEQGMTDTIHADGMDFDLGFGDASESVEETGEAPGVATDSELDFDLGFGEETEDGVEGAVEQAPVGSDSEVDFDLGLAAEADEAEESSAETSPLGSDSEVDFDLGSGEVVDADESVASEDSAEVADAAADDEGLDIVLGEEESDSSLDLDDEPAADSLATGASEAEADEGLDIVLDEEESASELGLDDQPSESSEAETDSDFAALFEEESPAEDTNLDFDLGEGAEDFGQADTVVVPAPEGVVETEVSVDDKAAAGDLPDVDDDLAALFESDEESVSTQDDTASASPAPGEAETVDGLATLFDAEPAEDGDNGPDLELGAADSEAEEEADFGALFEEESAAEGTDSTAVPELSDEDDGASGSEQEASADTENEESSGDFESTHYMLQDSPADKESPDSADVPMDADLSVPVDEVQAKLDLAQAYVDSGDQEGGRGILDEILAEGNEAQKQEAQALLDQMKGG